MQQPMNVADDRALAAEVLRVLAATGPLSFEQISEALGEDPDDVEWEDHLYGVVDEIGRIVELGDERLADAVTLLGGWTSTRRATAEEANGQYLELGGDLQPFVDVVKRSVPLAAGGRASIELAALPGRAATERLVGPPGWLRDVREGDLVGLHLHGGLLSVDLRPRPRTDGEATAAFAAVANELIAGSEHGRTSVIGAVWEAAAADPKAFTGVLPPLSDIAAAGGLQLTETMVLPGDADRSDVLPATDAIRNAIARVYSDADDEMLDDLAHLRSVARRLEFGSSPTDADLDRAAAALSDEDLYEVYLQDSVSCDGAELLGAVIAPRVDGTARAAACDLQARAAWMRDDMDAASTLVNAALQADPAFEPALVRASRIAEVGGDAAAALRYLQRAGRRDDERAQQLHRYAAGPKVGRNHPCPCGSGRKAKRCCGGGGVAMPLHARAAWLLLKVYASHTDRLGERLREQFDADGRVGDWLDERGLDHVLVADVAMFDLGVLDEFLHRWSGHLPDDERQLAESWRTTRRGVYQALRAGPSTVTLADRHSGAELTAQHAGTPPPRGEVVLARLLPDGGDGWLLTSGVTVDDEHHSAVELALDPHADPLDVVDIWAGDGPIMRTTEGEPSVLCTWEAPLCDEQPALLRDTLLTKGLSEDEPGVFIESVDVDGLPRVRGNVTVEDGLVRITTGSVPRLERLLGYVHDAAGELQPIVDRRTHAARAVADNHLYGVPAAPQEPTAEERSAIDQAMQMLERRWIDEAVPALSGLTPREARDHPTARRALIDLLDSFDDDPTPGGFDTDRLRALLDL